MSMILSCLYFSNTITVLESVSAIQDGVFFWKRVPADLTILQLPTSSRVNGWSSLMEDQMDNNTVEMTGEYRSILWFALSCFALVNPLSSLTLHISRARDRKKKTQATIVWVVYMRKNTISTCVDACACLCECLYVVHTHTHLQTFM